MASIDYDTKESINDLKNSGDSNDDDRSDDSESEEIESDSEAIELSDAQQWCKMTNK